MHASTRAWTRASHRSNNNNKKKSRPVRTPPDGASSARTHFLRYDRGTSSNPSSDPQLLLRVLLPRPLRPHQQPVSLSSLLVAQLATRATLATTYRSAAYAYTYGYHMA